MARAGQRNALPKWYNIESALIEDRVARHVGRRWDPTGSAILYPMAAVSERVTTSGIPT